MVCTAGVSTTTNVDRGGNGEKGGAGRGTTERRNGAAIRGGSTSGRSGSGKTDTGDKLRGITSGITRIAHIPVAGILSVASRAREMTTNKIKRAVNYNSRGLS